MGLLDLFGSKEDRERNALRRLVKKITERYGPPENRQKAIDQLGELGTPAALSALCQRFTVAAEPGINDAEEKETARRILVEAGDLAAQPVEQFVREQESGIAWGLRALAEIRPAERVSTFVLGELSRLSREYSRDPEKKLVLLTWLVEHQGGAPATEVETALLPLLEDFS
ncbi:MAG TPA: HEAT repeat domain-containing protein, partial [Anaeromyxobacter sp.]|nr:HEAT repeat domain-containing protein [Anaeromyxobacter sp.]